jgi:hypothetical protein
MIIFRKNSSRLLQKITNFISRLIVWNNNKTIFQHEELFLVLLTLAFFVSSIFIPNNKLFFILSSVFVSLILLITKSIFSTFIFSYIPLSIFSIGQEYSFLAVPKSIILSSQYPDGRMLSFIFSPHTVLLLSIIGITFLGFLLKKIKIFNLVVLSLLSVVFFIIFSASRSLYFSGFSMIYSLHWLGYVSFLLIFINYFNSLSKSRKNRFWKVLFFQISISLIFISSISAFQMVKRSPLGLNIESAKVAPIFGVGADESELIFRPVGLTPHANMMANETFILMMSLFVIYLKLKINKNFKIYFLNFFLLVFLASIFTIIISQSRSVYLALLFYLPLIIIFNKHELRKILSKLKILIKKYQKFWIVILAFISLVVLNRAWHSFYSFNETGGVEVRRELNQEAFFIIRKYNLLGVGSGMFIPSLAAENPTGVVQKFAESVHNGFLLFIAESGLLAQLFLFLTMFIFFRKIYFSKEKSSFKKIILIGLIAQLIPMFFQPFINYLSVYTIFTMVIILGEKKE